MRKYWYIFKSELMSSLQYVFNIFSRIIGYALIVFIFMNLWNYIYANPDEIINNYSITQMIWYITIAEVMYTSVSGRMFCSKIVNDVRSGNLVYKINKPYNYITYLVFSHLGEIALNFVICGISGLAIGYLFLGQFPDLNIISGLAVLITIILTLVINTLFIAFLGLFAFIIEDSRPLYWVYSKLLLIFGTLFPIDFFPKAIQGVLKFSPIYANSYGPARLFVEFSTYNFVCILISQIVYIILGYLMCLLLYKKGVKRLNVNGG